MDHQNLVLSLEFYHKRPKPVQEVLQRLSLPLFHPKKVKRDRRSSSVDYELFLEQSRKLVEGRDVAIWEANEPLQRCAYERAHEQLTVHGVHSSRDHHLSVERCEMDLWVFCTFEDGLGHHEVSRHDNIHDCL